VEVPEPRYGCWRTAVVRRAWSVNSRQCDTGSALEGVVVFVFSFCLSSSFVEETSEPSMMTDVYAM
jgi:hypothetical protein